MRSDFSTETSIEINDSVRGKDVFIIQTGSGWVNDDLKCLKCDICTPNAGVNKI